MNKNMATILKAEQYNIINIKWDTDGDEELFDSLPSQIVLPVQFVAIAEDENYLDEISDWLSDEYGYCNNGFSVQKTHIAYVNFSETQKRWVNELLHSSNTEILQKYKLEKEKALMLTISFDDNVRAQMRFDADFSEIILFDKDLEVCREKCQEGTWNANYNDIIYIIETDNMSAKKAKEIIDFVISEKVTSIPYPWEMQPEEMEKHIPYIMEYFLDLSKRHDIEKALFTAVSKADDEIKSPVY